MDDEEVKKSSTTPWWVYALVGGAAALGLVVVGKLMGDSSGSSDETKPKKSSSIPKKSKLEQEDEEDELEKALMEGDDDEGFENDEDEGEGSKMGNWEILVQRAEGLKQEGKFQESDACFEQAYEIIKKECDENHIYVGLLFATWAPVLTFLKKYEQAEKILKQFALQNHLSP